MDTLWSLEAFLCLKASLSPIIKFYQYWGSDKQYYPETKLNLCQQELLCSNYVIIGVIFILTFLQLVLQKDISKHFQRFQGVCISAVSFELTYLSILEIQKFRQGISIFQLVNWILALVILIFLLLRFMINFRSIYNIWKLLVLQQPQMQQLSSPIISEDYAKYNYYAFLHLNIKDQQIYLQKKQVYKLLIQLSINELYILNSILNATLICLVQNQFSIQCCIILVLQILLIMLILVIKQYNQRLIYLLEILLQVLLFTLCILVLMQDRIFQNRDIDYFNYLSLPITIVIFSIVSIIVIKRCTLLLLIIIQKCKTKSNTGRAQPAQTFQVDLSPIEEKAYSSEYNTIKEIIKETNKIFTGPRVTELVMPKPLEKKQQTQNNKQPEIYQKLKSVEQLLRPIDINSRSSTNVKNTKKYYYPDLNNELNDALSETKQESIKIIPVKRQSLLRFESGRKKAWEKLDTPIIANHISIEDFIDLQSHFGYDIQFKTLFTMEKAQYLQLILHSKLLQEKIVQHLPNSASTQCEKFKRDYFEFRTSVAELLLRGKIQDSLQLIK